MVWPCSPLSSLSKMKPDLFWITVETKVLL